jgi:chromosome segregation ATPase
MLSNNTTESLQSQLARLVEENDILSSRFRIQMNEKQIQKLQITDLSNKLMEAKNGLKDTSDALQKLWKATNQLLKQRDAREQQLQESLQNIEQQRQVILDLESKLAEQTNIIDNKRIERSLQNKKVSELQEQLLAMGDELNVVTLELSAKKRENCHILADKLDLESLLESKKRRIDLLEERLKKEMDMNAMVIQQTIGVDKRDTTIRHFVRALNLHHDTTDSVVPHHHSHRHHDSPISTTVEEQPTVEKVQPVSISPFPSNMD